MDFLFITETWLKPHSDEGRLHGLNPAGYIAKSFPLETRGGGIAVVYVSLLETTTFSVYIDLHQVEITN